MLGINTDYIIYFGILTIMFSALLIGSEMHEEGYSYEDLNNRTTSLDSVYVNASAHLLNYSESGNLSSSIVKIVYRGTDFFLFSAIELSKGALYYGYEHPNYDYKEVLKLFNYVVYAVLFAILIKPLLITIAIAWIIFDYIKIKIRGNNKEK